MERKNKIEHFCNLELDEKGFQLIVKYLKKCKQKEDFFIVDNGLQIKEIEAHMYRNWMDKNAGYHWVEEHAKNFRRYLNSIKLLWAAHVLEKGHDEEFNYSEYCRLVKNWPCVKDIMEDLF